jgi:hypothetical protein
MHSRHCTPPQPAAPRTRARRPLEIHAHANRTVRFYEGDARVRAEPFEAIELDLAALWGGPRTT